MLDKEVELLTYPNEPIDVLLIPELKRKKYTLAELYASSAKYSSWQELSAEVAKQVYFPLISSKLLPL